MNANRTPLAFALVLLATGCGAVESAGAAPREPSTAMAAPPAPVAVSPSNAERASDPTTPPSTTSAKTAPADSKQTQAERPDALVVYNGNLAMLVDDGKVTTIVDRIIDIGEGMGGHLDGRRDGSVTVRVPSPRFHEALEKISALGEVIHQSVTAEDVSEEFHDAEVRLQNLKATQKRLQEFLAHSASMSDMLNVEHELERVSMEIDRIEGRMRFLRDHSAFSTLTIEITARPKPQAIVATQTKSAPTPRILPLHAEWLDEIGVPALVAN